MINHDETAAQTAERKTCWVDADCYSIAYLKLPKVEDLRDRLWCYVCDRPKNDCACVENGGNY